MLVDPMDGLWHEISDHVQVNLVWFVTLGEESMAESDNVWVIELLDDLDFSVFVSLVLQNFLNRNHVSSLSTRRSKHNPKRSISNDSLSIVSVADLRFIIIMMVQSNNIFSFCLGCISSQGPRISTGHDYVLRPQFLLRSIVIEGIESLILSFCHAKNSVGKTQQN